MTVFFFCLGLLQCCLLWLVYRAGQIQIARAAAERQKVATVQVEWPACALVIPVSGSDPLIEAALRSLMLQDYPNYQVFMVTAESAEPASAIIGRLMLDYPNLTHVVAGTAQGCGQKNHNLLAGIAQVGSYADVYAFCDSTHIAESDFLRCLLYPQATGKAAFSVGYHEVIPQNRRLVILAYAINVLFMRFLEGIKGMTQPWGGAMAISRAAFDHFRINTLWASNVVDDCSLGAFLQRNKLPIVYCPAALLRTLAAAKSRSDWEAWLERQILFLKFCFPGQWLGLCLFSCFMLVPFLWCAAGVLEGLFNFGSFSSPFLALCWFFLFMGLMSLWRNFLPIKITAWRCFLAFLLSCAMLFMVMLRTIFTHAIYWHNITYNVGKNGQVLSIKEE